MTAPPLPSGERRRNQPVEEGAPTWVVTFGDMMSLLLTFFVLMFSMSELKVERFALASQSLREAMGSTGEAPAVEPLGLMPDPVDPELDLANPGLNNGATTNLVDGDGGEDDPIEVFAGAYMDMIEERLAQLVADAGLDESSVEIVVEEEGVYLRIRDAALFETAQASLNPEGQALVLSLSQITQGLEIPTIVSGHADSRPIRSAVFPSNWELSAARAAGVARLLVDAGQHPETVRVQSFGEYQPVADNETEEGRARNRRVELFFSRDAIREVALQLLLESPPPAAESPSEPEPEPDGAGSDPS
jgi:chemotaxis protein MotB